MVWWRKVLPIVLLNLLMSNASKGQEEQQSSDWGVVERVRGSDDTTVVEDKHGGSDRKTDNNQTTDNAGGAPAEAQEKEAQDNTPTAEPFAEEDIDYSPIVESVTKQTVEELGRNLVGGQDHVCLRCDRKNQISAQVLGVKTLVGVTGIEFTRHILSRTSLQAGIGYGFGGFNLGTAVLHFFREDGSLHLLAGLNVSIGTNGRDNSDYDERKNRRHTHEEERNFEENQERALEGLWMLVGVGSEFGTQVGIGYGVSFGITMALFENVFKRNMRLCFGVMSQASCQDKWRILPYLSPIKISYSF